ncbi:uncharacterized protein GGS22DRAFT_168102 [Annulohypoxylon maeteangense]|uniref:uncharacterized protein n=1 Tax=Annulohypoxylon maeteangense TaxID=1927788 RepID=UPI002008DE19|nr:uncharacterized protein GGS22DRAFT_168102 [Annulohypoxylon maeteangense]KAI0883199.1 hypothetical protein GGS22DRAFT_168102 [Annulohypoxylon maeteangense]
MKLPLLFTLNFLAPTILASTNHAATTSSPSAPIFVLRTTQTATSVLGKALSKLGYIHQDSRQGNSTAASNTNTYVEVSSDAQLLEITKSHPEAKFIIPRGSRLGEEGLGRTWWWGRESGGGAEMVMTTTTMGDGRGTWFAQAFTEKRIGDDGILELDVLALEKGAQAENWVRLCDFLGLGYSVVERFGLWHFPQ